MASDIDICNLALSNLGDSATVVSIDPPEGSAQADHCARFYPTARDALLEMHEWGFATQRFSSMAELTSPSKTWTHAYAMPSETLRVLAVQSDEDVDGVTSQPFSLEAIDGGQVVVLTNQENAVIRCTLRVTDTAKFSQLFIEALSWFLASKLAGPVVKGTEGMAVSRECLQQTRVWLDKAALSDSKQQHVRNDYVAPWVANR